MFIFFSLLYHLVEVYEDWCKMSCELKRVEKLEEYSLALWLPKFFDNLAKLIFYFIKEKYNYRQFLRLIFHLKKRDGENIVYTTYNVLRFYWWIYMWLQKLARHLLETLIVKLGT